jgi:hypothetical protein
MILAMSAGAFQGGLHSWLADLGRFAMIFFFSFSVYLNMSGIRRQKPWQVSIAMVFVGVVPARLILPFK